MKSARRKISLSSILSATDRAKHYGEETVAQALKYLSDPDKKQRLEIEVECKYCYYIWTGRIGGATITSQPCGVCGKLMSFGNTCTDVVCKDCGRKHDLCSHCGGDLHMRVRRKDCPEINPEEEKEPWED